MSVAENYIVGVQLAMKTSSTRWMIGYFLLNLELFIALKGSTSHYHLLDDAQVDIINQRETFSQLRWTI